jgi:inner membrane protein
MDNLTHSLVGALLGQIGLKRKTGLAIPTLIIAANIPDIDVVAVLLGGHQHLALRRGVTHGPIAWVVLPLLLWGAMLWFDRWQTRRGKRPEKRLPVHKGWLLGLAYIGTISHPALDWLNNYGVRLLEPFSHQWFYGDSIFIIDVWMLAALALGVWFSLRREKRGSANWQRPAWISFSFLIAYIACNYLISVQAESVARHAIQQNLHIEGDLIELRHGVIKETYTNAASSSVDPVRIELVVASPAPFFFWQREILWRANGYYGQGHYNVLASFDGVTFDKSIAATGMQNLYIANMKQKDKSARAFMFWSRMPVVSVDYSKKTVTLTDQRFSSSPARNNFTVTVGIDPE